MGEFAKNCNGSQNGWQRGDNRHRAELLNWSRKRNTRNFSRRTSREMHEGIFNHMLRVSLLAVAAVVAITTPVSLAAIPAHPRLVLTPSRITDLQAAVASNQQAAFFYNGTAAQATYLLGVPPAPVPGPNKTGDARYALQRIYSLSIMWALTHNTSWAARAYAEALVVTEWPCFDVPCGEAQLNTGEALHALAMALDWLYDYLSVKQRATIVTYVPVETGLPLRGLTWPCFYRPRQSHGEQGPFQCRAGIHSATADLGGCICQYDEQLEHGRERWHDPRLPRRCGWVAAAGTDSCRAAVSGPDPYMLLYLPSLARQASLACLPG